MYSILHGYLRYILHTCSIAKQRCYSLVFVVIFVLGGLPRAMMVVKSACCRKEGPGVSLCEIAGVQQPVAEGAAQ